MIEKHPFGIFVPKKVKYLLLGSFVTKPTIPYQWFYANGRNQFWPILEEVYGTSLQIKSEQQKLFSDLKIAISDIILKCERAKNSNLDINLKIFEFNTEVITKVLKDYPIHKIYFTSRFVEKLYRSKFKNLIIQYPKIELITLPSPSPRYAQITKAEKVTIYKKKLPKP